MVKIAEIFRSTQGEGRNAGSAAVFIRLSGCNLKCPFCDTDHSGKDMEEADVAREVMNLRKDANINLVIFTGGEPSLQMGAMHKIISIMENLGFIGTFAVESNGTCDPKEFKSIGIDFVTISPKNLWVDNAVSSSKVETWGSASEIKCLYDTSKEPGVMHEYLSNIANAAGRNTWLYLQPITDHKDPKVTERNIQNVLAYITCVDSRWKISMQLQNIWNVR